MSMRQYKFRLQDLYLRWSKRSGIGSCTNVSVYITRHVLGPISASWNIRNSNMPVSGRPQLNGELGHYLQRNPSVPATLWQLCNAVWHVHRGFSCLIICPCTSPAIGIAVSEFFCQLTPNNNCVCWGGSNELLFSIFAHMQYLCQEFFPIRGSHP